MTKLDNRNSKLIKKKNKKYCRYDECYKQASYNFRTEDRVIYCNQHKLEGMINIKVKRCVYKDCFNQAYFNYCYF